MKKLLLAILILTTVFSAKVFSQETGLVLAGGGGKGAYEVGVWKALNEYGFAKKITTISGTSVGGLNSALFACVDNYEAIENICKNLVPSYLTEGDALISQAGLSRIISMIPLTRLQKNQYPRVTVTAVKNRFIITKTFLNSFSDKPGSYASRFCLNEERNQTEIKNKLLATSAFPVACNPIKLADGYEYYDGGFEQAGGDNVPLEPIVKNNGKNGVNVKTIIIVYLEKNPERVYRDIDYDQFKLIRIIPTIELGNILEGTTNFTAQRINMLIEYGYNDAVKVLKQNGYNPVSNYWFED